MDSLSQQCSSIPVGIPRMEPLLEGNDNQVLEGYQIYTIDK